MIKNKGIIKIELLSVFIIIGIIIAMMVLNFINIIEAAMLEQYNNQKILVKKAAQIYFFSNNLLPIDDEETNYVSLKKLIDEEYIDEVVDPKNKLPCFYDTSGVKVENINGNFIYCVYLNCTHYKSNE